MAERPGPSKIAALVLVGLGAFLLIAALLIPLYTVGKLEKTPLNLAVTTVSTGTGSVLDATSLAAGKAVINQNVPIVSQRFLTAEDPSNAANITIQAGTTVRRTDKQGDTGLLSATVDRVTIDRNTGAPEEPPVGSIQAQGDKPADEVSHTGLQYRFPFHTEKKSYPYFDINSRASANIDYVADDEINGVKVYKFAQTIAPVDLSKVTNSPSNKVSLPADTWGVAGGATPITMTRFYSTVRTLWVEPDTGTIIKGEEDINQFYARNAAKPEVQVLEVPLVFDENTIEFQIQQAKAGTDKINIFARIVPITAVVLGVIALIAGIVLGLRGRSGSEGRSAGGSYGRGPDGPDDHGPDDQGPDDQGPDERGPDDQPAHYSDEDRTEAIPKTSLRKD